MASQTLVIASAMTQTAPQAIATSFALRRTSLQSLATAFAYRSACPQAVATSAASSQRASQTFAMASALRRTSPQALASTFASSRNALQRPATASAHSWNNESAEIAPGSRFVNRVRPNEPVCPSAAPSSMAVFEPRSLTSNESPLIANSTCRRAARRDGRAALYAATLRRSRSTAFASWRSVCS